MQHYEIAQVRAELSDRHDRYFEFLRSSALSAGVYRLAAGQFDPQLPHREDELYYVVEGEAKMEVGPQRLSVRPGSVIYVPAREEHRFVDITSNLTVLVFFAPPESSAPADPQEEDT